MPEDMTVKGTRVDPRTPSSPLHPHVDAATTIDACPYAALIRGMNVDPDLLFSVLTQFFGAHGANEAALTTEDGVPAPQD